MCSELATSLLLLSPSPSRQEYEHDPTLRGLAALYSKAKGASALHDLEEYLKEVDDIPFFSTYPNEQQLSKAIDRAYKGEENESLRHLLHAYELFFRHRDPGQSELLHGVVETSARVLDPKSKVSFCSGCGASSPPGAATCGTCNSPMVVLTCVELGTSTKKGVELHVPAEMYVAQILEEAGFHLLSKRVAGADYSLSFTFQAFGSKIDVDAVGLGHPNCILLVDVTTSRVDQGKTASIRGTLSLLEKFIRERNDRAPPIQCVLVTTSEIDGNVDFVALDRAGLSLFGGEALPHLVSEFRKIPQRLTR